MHLTQFSDYSLRLAIYLACHPEQVVSVDEISRAFGISRHHLVKVVQTLTELGVVEAQRGRGGGMRLAMRPVGDQRRLADPPDRAASQPRRVLRPRDEYLPDRPGLRIEGAAPARPAGVPGRPRRVHPRPASDAAGRPDHLAGQFARSRELARRSRVRIAPWQPMAASRSIRGAKFSKPPHGIAERPRASWGAVFPYCHILQLYCNNSLVELSKIILIFFGLS